MCWLSRNVGGSESEFCALRKDRGMRSIGNLPNGCSKRINPICRNRYFRVLSRSSQTVQHSVISYPAGQDKFRIPDDDTIKIGLTTPRFALM